MSCTDGKPCKKCKDRQDRIAEKCVAKLKKRALARVPTIRHTDFEDQQPREPESDFDARALIKGKFHRLSHVFRYSSIPVIRKENVSEHSWYVAFYALVIGKDLKLRGFKVDMGKLLSRALVHDIDESMTGDFLRGVKYGHPDLKRVLDELSIKMIDEMQTELGVNFEDEWTNSKARDIEGDIICVVDLARVLSYVIEEMKSGNMYVRDIVEECCSWLGKFMVERSTSPLVRYAGDLMAAARKEAEKYAGL